MTDLQFAPPQNLDAEDRVLGSLIVFYTPQLLDTVQGAGLKWQDFYRENARVVYWAILRMHEAGTHVDTLTLSRYLECQCRRPDGDLLRDRTGEPTNLLTMIGGPARIEYLAGFAQVNGLKEAASMVAEDGLARRLRLLGFEAQDALQARDMDAYWEIVERIRKFAPVKVESAPGDLRVLEGGREKAA